MPVASSERRPEYSLDPITSAPTKPLRRSVTPLQWAILALCVVVAAVLGYFVLQYGWTAFTGYVAAAAVCAAVTGFAIRR